MNLNLQVNGKNVEHEYHADVVSLVRESEEVVNLLVVSVRSQQTAITAKRAVHKVKFCLNFTFVFYVSLCNIGKYYNGISHL